MMEKSAVPTVRLHDRTFRRLIPHARLQKAIAAVARRIGRDYAEKETPVFLGVLNGSFMFMGELLQRIGFDCEVSFVKLASYAGLNSSGQVKELIGLNGSVAGRHVIIVEDIVDTGESIEHLIRALAGYRPASVAVATLLLKPEVYRKEIKIDYCALEVPDRFIVGFGLDYNQLGRNLKDIYEVAE